MPEGPSGPCTEGCQPNEPFLPSKDDELELITLVSFLVPSVCAGTRAGKEL